MAKKYIDAEKLTAIDNVDNYSAFMAGIADRTDLQAIVDDAPAANVAEVRHGEWKDYRADDKMWQRKDGNSVFVFCSCCEAAQLRNFLVNTNYCPNCGARMERGNKKNE